MTEEITKESLPQSAEQINTEQNVKEESTPFFPKVDPEIQRIVINKGVEILEQMATGKPRKNEQKQFGVYFSPEEIQLLEIYARELFNDGYISRNSIGSLCRFCTIAFLKNSQDRALENVRARQAAEQQKVAEQRKVN